MSVPNTDFDQVNSFLALLSTELTDPRDNRGKRHKLEFIITAVILAIMVGRSTVSGIHRFIKNKITWLRQVTQLPDAKAVSRAHLPRLLAIIIWEDLNETIEQYFGIQIQHRPKNEWTALDGKTLRGTTHVDDKQGERILTAVTHKTKTIVAQRPMDGPKSSEVPAVRQLLKNTGLEKEKVTLDALHCNPETTSQIHCAGGRFIIQVKDNQPKLRAQCETLANEAQSLGMHMTADEGHGRIEIRIANFVSMEGLSLEDRWQTSGLRSLIELTRITSETAKNEVTEKTSYYVTNQPIRASQKTLQVDVFTAIRHHWQIESGHWIRDVTFKEDHVKTKNGNQAQVMASLRSVAIKLFRKANIGNFRAAIDNFADSNAQFESMLHRLNFL